MSKLKKNELIQKIMTKNPVTIEKRTKISEAAKLLLEKKMHHLPVVSGEKIIGMFSYTDLMRLDFSDSFGQDQREVLATLDSSKSIEEVMAKDLVTIKERDTVQSAAKLLCDGRNFHSLPVLNQDGKLSGIVTSTDIIRFLAEL